MQFWYVFSKGMALPRANVAVMGVEKVLHFAKSGYGQLYIMV